MRKTRFAKFMVGPLPNPHLTLHALDQLLRVVADTLSEDERHVVDVGRRVDGIPLDHGEIGDLARLDRPVPTGFAEQCGAVRAHDPYRFLGREASLHEELEVAKVTIAGEAAVPPGIHARDEQTTGAYERAVVLHHLLEEWEREVELALLGT